MKHRIDYRSQILVLWMEKMDNFTIYSSKSIIKLGQTDHFNAWKKSDKRQSSHHQCSPQTITTETSSKKTSRRGKKRFS